MLSNSYCIFFLGFGFSVGFFIYWLKSDCVLLQNILGCCVCKIYTNLQLWVLDTAGVSSSSELGAVLGAGRQEKHSAVSCLQL